MGQDLQIDLQTEVARVAHLTAAEGSARSELQAMEGIVHHLHARDDELYADLLHDFGDILYIQGCISPKAASPRNLREAKTCQGITSAAVVTHSLRAEVSEQAERVEALRKEHTEMQIASASQAATLQQELYEARGVAATSEGKLAAHQATVQRSSCELQRALQLAVAEFSSRIASSTEIVSPRPNTPKTQAMNNEAG